MSSKGKWFKMFIAILPFFIGLGVLLYPAVRGTAVGWHMKYEADSFLSRVESDPYEPPENTGSYIETEPPEPTVPDIYPELWEAMYAYNEALLEDGQAGLDSPSSYEESSFYLPDYGVESEVFGVLTIPGLDLKMPLYLGANDANMAKGAAVLSQTSLPIGGKGTNAVIAGHRGWRGAAYFLNIHHLKPGEEVIITNLWDELTYKVTDIQIIPPNDIEAIKIQPGKEIITLLTCHPPGSGGKQRYLVFCERTTE